MIHCCHNGRNAAVSIVNRRMPKAYLPYHGSEDVAVVIQDISLMAQPDHVSHDPCDKEGSRVPLFHDGLHAHPPWGELAAFEIVYLPVGAHQRFERCDVKERLIVASGLCHLTWGDQECDASEGTKGELRVGDEGFTVHAVMQPTTLVRLNGRWGEETGGWGLFTVQTVEHPTERGDPTDYPKQTAMDNHYHDCDEYYILLEGRGVVVSEGIHYAVGPGDCVATRMGDHHDFPLVSEPVWAVYCETTLKGARRRGHLWNHTHGPAHPHPDQE